MKTAVDYSLATRAYVQYLEQTYGFVNLSYIQYQTLLGEWVHLSGFRATVKIAELKERFEQENKENQQKKLDTLKSLL